jgi:hypothetical protein
MAYIYQPCNSNFEHRFQQNVFICYINTLYVSDSQIFRVEPQTFQFYYESGASLCLTRWDRCQLLFLQATYCPWHLQPAK